MALLGNFLAAACLTALCCYLLGSVNLAVLVSSRKFGRDVRTCGSGNAGSTNMLRTFGWKAAIPVFLGDMLKGALAVWAGVELFSLFSAEWKEAGYLGGFFALVGHMWPVWFGFRGGKGVAAGLGIVIALHPVAGPLLLLSGFAVAALSGYVSMASVLGAAAYPVMAACLGGWKEFWPGLALAALILYGHRENIRRLLAHKENKFTPPPKG